MNDAARILGFALLIPAMGFALGWLIQRRRRAPARGILLGVGLALLFLALRLILASLSGATMGGLQSAAEQALGALAAFAAAFAIDAAIRRHLWQGLLGDGATSQVPTIVIGLCSLAGYGLTALLVASLIFGLDVSAVAATSGVVAIVLGVSAQQTLGQVFAGLALNTARPFRLGDSVQVDGIWGIVTDANWRSVTLRTYEGTLVTLPNTLVASVKLTNMDQPHHDLRHHIPFVVGQEVPPGRVQAVGVAAMAALPQVLTTPAPMVLFKNYEDRGIGYEAIFWHHDPNLYILRRDEVGQALWYAFERAGIPILGHRRLQGLPEAKLPAFTMGEPEAEEAQLLACLRRLPLLDGFPAEELAALAARARRRRFAPGERVMRQDEPGESLFIILDGRISVRLEADGTETEIYTQEAGEAVGHMSAMTGAPRLATVRAASHLTLAELDRAAIAPLIERHPEVVDKVAREILRIEAAHEGLQRARALRGDTAMAAGQAGLIDRLSEGIRSFFASRPAP